MSILNTQHLSIGYKGKSILRNLNLSINRGEMICLVGPNGSGKSTLIKTLTNMLAPLEGEVRIDVGTDQRSITDLSVKELAQYISIVLTEKIPVSNFNVYDIVSLGRVPYTNWLGNLSKNDEAIIEHAMQIVGISQFSGRLVDSLSDGEQQRVMFAKALAQDTEIIILDEPTAHLDVVYRAELLSQLKRLARDTNKAILISTHELDMAIQAADIVWLINNQSELYASSPEDLILSNKFTETFSGDQIYFNDNNGTFSMKHKGNKKIQLSGNGKRYHWTKHALEKREFEVVSAHNELCVLVHEDNWEIIVNKNRKLVFSIDELLVHLGF